MKMLKVYDRIDDSRQSRYSVADSRRSILDCRCLSRPGLELVHRILHADADEPAGLVRLLAVGLLLEELAT